MPSRECGRQTGEGLFETVYDIACDEACEQGTEESGATSIGKCAADEADSKAWTVSDTHGNEAGEDRKHEAERCAACIFEEFRIPGVGTEIARVCGIKGINEEGECDEDTTADNERKHMGYTVHEVFVDLTRYALIIAVGD